ncbi:hypothetical protein ACET3Z_025930 [Daucus carota]
MGEVVQPLFYPPPYIHISLPFHHPIISTHTTHFSTILPLMFARKARPVINSLITGASGSGHRSPTSPSDMIKIQSPRVLKNYGGAVGVGLGIVAALDKNTETQALCNKSVNNSVPIAVSCSVRNRGNTEESVGDSLEDYTYVTSYGPNNKKGQTRVYYGGCQNSEKRSHRLHSNKKNHPGCVFQICPETTVESAAGRDFLSSCHMCRKKLHGEDIYMYRGEKAYCSTECRERQIVMDEKKENKRISQASSRSTVSTSPCSAHDRPMFTTGIFAI